MGEKVFDVMTKAARAEYFAQAGARGWGDDIVSGFVSDKGYGVAEVAHEIACERRACRGVTINDVREAFRQRDAIDAEIARDAARQAEQDAEYGPDFDEFVPDDDEQDDAEFDEARFQKLLRRAPWHLGDDGTMSTVLVCDVCGYVETFATRDDALGFLLDGEACVHGDHDDHAEQDDDEPEPDRGSGARRLLCVIALLVALGLGGIGGHGVSAAPCRAVFRPCPTATPYAKPKAPYVKGVPTPSATPAPVPTEQRPAQAGPMPMPMPRR